MSQQQGYTSTVTSDQIISSVQADAGLMDNNFYSILIEKWVFEGARHLGTNQLFIKNLKSLTVTDNKATLPQDFRRLLSLRYSSDIELERADGTTETVTRCIPLVYVDSVFLSDCGCDNNILGGGWQNYLASFQIVGNEILFRQNIVDGSTVQLSYLGFNLDDNCMLLLSSDWERALTAYAKYKLFSAYPELKGRATPMLMQDSKNEWIAQKRWCKAIATSQEFTNNRYQINALSRAWFVNQNVIAGAQL